MRRAGQPSLTVLEQLRPQIESLAPQARAQLVLGVRYYEARQKPNGNPKPAVSVPPRVATDAPTPPASIPAVNGTPCPKCKAINRADEVICRSCGHVLISDDKLLSVMTRQLADQAPQENRFFFPPDATLNLYMPEHKQTLSLRPQDYDRAILFGRFDDNSGLAPDVDFTKFDGVKLGVSRLHMTMTYDARFNQLSVKDMASANGLFANGQRLVPYQPYIVQDHDRLVLGQLILRVSFQHVNEKASVQV